MKNLRLFTDKVLEIIDRQDIKYDFTNTHKYLYVSKVDMILIPLENRIRDVNNHHICWVADKYKLDIRKYNYPLELTYRILSLFHEIGHKIYTENGVYNSERDKQERIAHVQYVYQYGDNYDMYRSIESERLADAYSVSLWIEHEKEILDFLKKYSRYFVDK